MLSQIREIKIGLKMVDILIVDLDGTLIKTDMLHESFWSSVNKNWIAALSSLPSVRYGKAALKVKLSKTSSVDVTTLPYNQSVIDFIKNIVRQEGALY